MSVTRRRDDVGRGSERAPAGKACDELGSKEKDMAAERRGSSFGKEA